jgi:hypothetical protein
MKLSKLNGWDTIHHLINESYLDDEFRVKDCNRRVAAMKFLQHQLNESKEPQTGIYFWIPSGKEWRLETFFDSQFPSKPGFDLDHSSIWRKWSSTMLRLNDPDSTKEIRHNYSGLPRGRVTTFIGRRPSGSKARKYLILHGNDSPVKNAAELIADRFYLPDGFWVWEFDDHERMNFDDVHAIKRFLKKT